MPESFTSVGEARAAFEPGEGVAFRCGVCGRTHSAAGTGWKPCARRLAGEWGMAADAPVPDSGVYMWDMPDPLVALMRDAGDFQRRFEAVWAAAPSPAGAARLPGWPAVLALVQPEAVLALTETWDAWWSLVEEWLRLAGPELGTFWHPWVPRKAPAYLKVTREDPLWGALCGRDVLLYRHAPCGDVYVGQHAIAFQTRAEERDRVVLQVHLCSGVRLGVWFRRRAVMMGVVRDPVWALRVVDPAVKAARRGGVLAGEDGLQCR